MASQDKVNLMFWTDNLSFTVITSREQAIGFRNEWHNVSSNKIAVSGNFNCADGNPLELEFDSNLIIGMQIMELNKF